MRFEEILVIATLFSFMLYLYDLFYLKPKRNADSSLTRPAWIDFILSILPVLALVLVVRSFIYEPFRIPSTSMKPTLFIGDFIVVNKYNYGLRLPISGTEVFELGKPARGDIIVFRADNHQDVIKRVIGIPGDHVEYKDKVLYLNSKPLSLENIGVVEDQEGVMYHKKEQVGSKLHDIYINIRGLEPDYKFSDITVPAGKYFVMGDNRDNSVDSRFWGFVPEHRIIGRAFGTFLSLDYDNTGLLPFSVRWNRIGKKLT